MEPISHTPMTEAEAAAIEKLLRTPGGVGSRRVRVLLKVIELNDPTGRWGVSRIELAEALGTTRDHVHPRIMELEKGDWVKRLGRLGETGVLFVPTPKAMRWLHKYEEERTDEPVAG